MKFIQRGYDGKKSANPEKNLVVIEGFSARLEVQNDGSDAPAHTGQIRAEPAGKEPPTGPIP
ncbi:hypothetical protein ACS25B_12280 [Dickeya dadantii subsp. dieffenbachiae]|uniref:hypothetical protein n=1 Tax=Dickeya dadantii TaxID=204038 RepID=UPI000A98B478|nr:hypothetical protein [Dickeya dadantii]